MKRLSAILFAAFALASARADLFINEIEYDNVGADSNEWVEIAGTAGQSLNGYELVYINGGNGLEYATNDLTSASFTFTDETGSGWGFFVVGLVDPGYGVSPDFTPAGWTGIAMQNGAPDSIQLRLISGSVNEHYVDYEGTNILDAATADQVTTLGDAATAFSTLYLAGTGDVFSAFAFNNSAGNGTPGALNVGQQIIPEPATVGLVMMGATAAWWRRRRNHVELA